MKEEGELIKRAKNRDSEAFGLLYDQYQPAIYRFILLKIGNKVTAEDLTHQVFLNAWQRIESYQIQGFPFSSWLYRIAHNAVIDYYRTEKKDINLDSIAETAAVNNLEEKIDQEFELNIIKAALKELPEEQQSIIIMKFVEDMTNGEIAAALGKSEGAIKTAQHRCIQNIKEIINGKYNRKIKEV
ncbi:MAG: sigma-70 family RNA polymerase sigma factor [Candidatus Paceibacterota bacterium]